MQLGEEEAEDEAAAAPPAVPALDRGVLVHGLRGQPPQVPLQRRVVVLRGDRREHLDTHRHLRRHGQRVPVQEEKIFRAFHT